MGGGSGKWEGGGEPRYEETQRYRDAGREETGRGEPQG